MLLWGGWVGLAARLCCVVDVFVLLLNRITAADRSVGVKALLQGWLLCVGFVCLANVP